ncbi:plasmid stabilization protein [Mesorhizobium sp. L-8-10]|uniref:type II toxin-antitoxin system RelE/ParE family toxin n=1 Tax=Mesorhizobium sp. L-8-10 TaxID=2744523 RepID=UPI0019275D87|nr:type II toxin-antitoxin system RelE/ParE family toxin [Mesorhizobium sp. L-8-10]BCH34099.1 plasmid stabilization protein [Mesorhizobium sp. L-8-10]
MAHKVTFSVDAERDFELIFDFLFESRIEFGEAAGTAVERAEERVQSIRADIEALPRAPYGGTMHDDVLPGLRDVTLGRAVVWFDIVEDKGDVRVLAIFFGGQDHMRRMLVRLLRQHSAA